LTACDEGFVADVTNGYCYKVLPDLAVEPDGADTCLKSYDGDLLLFYKDAEITAILSLLKSSLFCLLFLISNKIFRHFPSSKVYIAFNVGMECNAIIELDNWKKLHCRFVLITINYFI
jgi:hypothetical protein